MIKKHDYEKFMSEKNRENFSMERKKDTRDQESEKRNPFDTFIYCRQTLIINNLKKLKYFKMFCLLLWRHLNTTNLMKNLLR